MSGYNKDRNYVGSGWEHSFDNGGSVINLSLNMKKLSQLPQDDHGNVRITVAELRSVDKKSKATHSVFEDTYRRTSGGSRREGRSSDRDSDGAPF